MPVKMKKMKLQGKNKNCPEKVIIWYNSGGKNHLLPMKKSKNQQKMTSTVTFHLHSGKNTDPSIVMNPTEFVSLILPF